MSTVMELPILTHEYILRSKCGLQNTHIPIGERVIDNLKANPHLAVQVEAETGRSITNKELLHQTVSIAEWMKSRGVKPDDVIGICSENRLEFFPAVAATLCIGASVNTLNPLYTLDELKHVMSITKPKIVFCSPFTVSKLMEAQNILPFIEEIVLFDSGLEAHKFTSFVKLMERKVDVDSFRCEEVDVRKSVAGLLCSSGTTGLPKCVELTQSNFGCVLEVTRVADLYHNTPIMGLVPFFHGYGFVLLLGSLIFNAGIVILSKFDEKTFLSTIEKYKLGRIHIVPPLALFLAKHPLVDKYDLSSLKEVICGAAPLSREIENQIKNRLKSVEKVCQAYGMTELSIAVTLQPHNKSRTGSVGVVAPSMECKVVDTETGKALPPYEEGELCFRGPLLMKGYRNNPVATAETIDSDGWLHTGDIGYYDEDGFMYIVDRLKELIKYKAFQVPPAELEALLLTNPKIKEAGVVGLPNDEAGELPMALVVLQPNAKATEDEIKKFVAGKVSPQKRIHHVRFVNEVPKNPSGKIIRRELRKMLAKSKL